MRSAFAAAACLLAACLAWAQPAAAPAPTVLRDAAGTLDASALGEMWVDSTGRATIEQVAAPGGPARFAAAQPGRILTLGPDAALWRRLSIARPRDDRQTWVLEFPMPTLDRVTVYQQEGGRWRAETAGDTLAVADWPEPGRQPVFRLDLARGQARDIYVQIRNTSSANVPVRLSTERAYDQRIQREYLGLGTVFGALILLIATCLAQSWIYRDRAYAWYSAYATVTGLAVAGYTGVAAHLLWPAFGALQDAPVQMLSLLFVRNLVGVSARFPLLDRAVFVLGAAGLVLWVLPPLLPKMAALTLLSVYVLLATFVNVGLALAAWRRGDPVGLWVFLSYVPLTLAVGMSVLRLFGWMPVFFGSQYAVVVAMAIEVPLLLIALSLRARERHGAEIREQALSTQDALTGLLAPHLFHDRLRQVTSRHKRHRESAAILFIDLVNHARIKEVYGSAAAEQSLLRSVIKLRRLLRDVDTVSRIGEARFGVILEGVTNRAPVTDRAARLIAAGLMPLAGLKPDVTLQFHVASVLLDERSLDAEQVQEELSALLASMSPRTRRPIRFVSAEDTVPSPLGHDSSLLQDSETEAASAGPASASSTPKPRLTAVP